MTIVEQQQLIVPLVIWGSKFSKSPIVQLYLLPNEQRIITGNADGQIWQWIIDEAPNSKCFHPELLMLSHERPITCIASTSEPSTLSNLITCSEDGFISQWDGTSGRVLFTTRSNYIHRKMKAYHAGGKHLLFCSGDYVDLLVLNTNDLSIYTIYVSSSNPSPIISFVVVYELLCGISSCETIKIWHLSSLCKTEESPIYDDASKMVKLSGARNLSYSCECNPKILLIICRKSWQILDSESLEQLIVSECAVEPVEGVLIDFDRVAIGFADSTIVLFQLPRSKICQVGENIVNTDQPFVFALMRNEHVINQHLSGLTIHFSHIQLENKMMNRIVCQHLNSTLVFWKIPRNFDVLVNELFRNRRPIIYEPTLNQSLQKSWEEMVISWSLAKFKDLDITATIHIGRQNRLFIGLGNGSIVVTNATHFIENNFLGENQGNFYDSHVQLLNDVHKDSVTCFLYPFDENQRYDPSTLFSGGADSAVVALNVISGECLYRFCAQVGPILRLLVPPLNCTIRMAQTICSIAGDNSLCIFNLSDNKCLLLASRQQYPIKTVMWRPLDDLLLLRCEDGSVYVWNLESTSLDRIITGQRARFLVEAHSNLKNDSVDNETAKIRGSIQALGHRNFSTPVSTKSANNFDECSESVQHQFCQQQQQIILPSPMDVIHLKNVSEQTFLVLLSVDAIISGLLALDNDKKISIRTRNTLSLQQQNSPIESDIFPSRISPSMLDNEPLNSTVTGKEEYSMMYIQIARLLISVLHSWNLCPDLDQICVEQLKLFQPQPSVCFGIMTKTNCAALYTPYYIGRAEALLNSFPSNEDLKVMWRFHWQKNSLLTTTHLLSLISIANTIMALHGQSLRLSAFPPSPLLAISNNNNMNSKKFLSSIGRRLHSNRNSSTSDTSPNEEAECHQIKQTWSRIAAFHCVNVPDWVREQYAAPQIDMLARRWQHNCIEIRDAAQALLIRELTRLGKRGRLQLTFWWAEFLPTQIDPNLSIFGSDFATTAMSTNFPETTYQSKNLGKAPSEPPDLAHEVDESCSYQHQFPSSSPLSKPIPIAVHCIPSQSSAPPPIPQRSPKSNVLLPSSLPLAEEFNPNAAKDSNNDDNYTPQKRAKSTTFGKEANFIQVECTKGGIEQVQRNQATAIILLGVIGTEFPNDLNQYIDIVRSIAVCLLHLILCGQTSNLPISLRRSAIDLLGRGFSLWQPHLDFQKVLNALLELAAMEAPSIALVAKHTLTVIVSSQPGAFLSTLGIEIARYNATLQHQTVQQHATHSANSPLIKTRLEVLRLMEQISETHSALLSESILQVGEILVHCVDPNALKQHSLVEIFPPLSKFYMVSYCPSTKRIAFGGKNGTIVIHEFRTSKNQVIQAHRSPITAVEFSQDGKNLASYSAQEAKLAFWQTQQTFLGMGNNQVRMIKSLPAPAEFLVLSPGSGNYQPFKARLVWINAKSLTLMLPNGKENRFSL